jgi:SOUL heme-binding protein
VPPVEVRQYDPYLIAEVTFKKSEAQDMKAALSGGFRAIAGYIFDSRVGHRPRATAKGLRRATCARAAWDQQMHRALLYATHRIHAASTEQYAGRPCRVRGSTRRARRRSR